MKMQFNLQSCRLVHTPGLIANWQHMARTGDRSLAFFQCALAFPTLPALLVYDLIDGHADTKTNKKTETVTITWSEPTREFAAYRELEVKSHQDNLTGILQQTISTKGMPELLRHIDMAFDRVFDDVDDQAQRRKLNRQALALRSLRF